MARPIFLSDRSTEKTVSELVAAEEARRAAQANLDNYQANSSEPEPPEQFPNIRAFIAYHHANREYWEGVDKLSSALASAEERYARAADTLKDVLPEDVPLTYDYADQTPQRRRYAITNRQGEIVVEGGARL